MNGDMFPEAHVDPTIDPDRRYTTRATIEWCLEVSGFMGFDLDVAADAESHWANKWYAAPGTPADSGHAGIDGLQLEWAHPYLYWTVWCNPPYSDLEPWVAKAWSEWRTGQCRIAMLLPANRTEQPFWQKLVEPHRDRPSPGRPPGYHLRSHFLPARTRFGHPGNREGVGSGSPPFGCVLLVWP